jgi:hypothetical protein
MNTPDVMLPERTLSRSCSGAKANPRWPRGADLQAFSRSAEDKRAARLLPEASQNLPIEAIDDADLPVD